MSEPVVSRELIARHAEAAARMHAAEGGARPLNPFPVGSDAHAAWEASFERWVHALQAPEGEGTA